MMLTLPSGSTESAGRSCSARLVGDEHELAVRGERQHVGQRADRDELRKSAGRRGEQRRCLDWSSTASSIAIATTPPCTATLFAWLPHWETSMGASAVGFAGSEMSRTSTCGILQIDGEDPVGSGIVRGDFRSTAIESQVRWTPIAVSVMSFGGGAPATEPACHTIAPSPMRAPARSCVALPASRRVLLQSRSGRNRNNGLRRRDDE